MLSNLKYEGGGDNTHGDAKALPPFTTSGYFGGSQAAAYTVMGIANPGGSDDYTNTTADGGFYGYLYNWCAAMGGQPNACNNTSGIGTTFTDASICPAGWRLPTSRAGGELKTLNDITNDGAEYTSEGLRTNFLAVYSGDYGNNLGFWGSRANIWSSMVIAASRADAMYFDSFISNTTLSNKYYGFAVRCVR